MKSIEQLKQDMANKLAKAASKLEPSEKLQVCASQNISTKTFDRYTSGECKEVRRMEVAEKLIEAIKKIKQPANA